MGRHEDEPGRLAEFLDDLVGAVVFEDVLDVGIVVAGADHIAAARADAAIGSERQMDQLHAVRCGAFAEKRNGIDVVANRGIADLLIRLRERLLVLPSPLDLRAVHRGGEDAHMQAIGNFSERARLTRESTGYSTQVSSREERLAANEELFRQVNERIAELTDKWGGNLDLVCECADTTCAQRIVLTLHEYEQLRQDAHRFAVRPGHEIPDIEDVVERNDRYLVVEKHVETHAQVEDSDPRS